MGGLGVTAALVGLSTPNAAAAPVPLSATCGAGPSSTAAANSSGGSSGTATVITPTTSRGSASSSATMQPSGTSNGVTMSGTRGPSGSAPPSGGVGTYAVPGAPTGVSANAGNAQATVYWTAPGSNGGATISAYAITYTDSDASCSATITVTAPASGSTFSYAVTGLTNGDHYTFTVAAINSAGDSAPSNTSNSVQPLDVPPVPGTPTVASSASGTVTVTWTEAVAGADQASPTGFTVTASGGATKTVAVGGGILVTGGSTDMTGLSNGTAYTFTVSANSAVGSSAPSTASGSITPAAAPGVPTNVTAVPGDTRAVVSWTAPANADTAVTGYTVTALGPGGGPPVTPSTVSVTGTTTAVVGTGVPAGNAALTNGSAYTFTVVATGPSGSSAASALSNTVVPNPVPPLPPTDVSATAGDTTATVTWSPPPDNNIPIDAYTITPVVGGTAGTAIPVVPGTTVGVSATPPYSYTVTGLTNGQSYTFQVASVNTSGSPSQGVTPSPLGSSTAVTTSAVIPAAAPDKPTGVTATAGDASATVNWTAPTNTGGSSLTKFTITVHGGTQNGSTVDVTGATATSGTVTGLTNGVEYTFTVTASNASSASAASDASNAVTPTAAAPPPTDPIDVKYAQTGVAALLGTAVGSRQTLTGGAEWQAYQNGNIYYSSGTAAHIVRGAILSEYVAASGPTGTWGFPTTDETAITGGSMSTFQAANIYWSASTGAHGVTGAILSEYLAGGGPSSWGFPTTDEYSVSTGRASNFSANLRIYWSAGTGAHEVNGAILGTYLSLGGPGGTLGFPVSDEYTVTGGRQSSFQHGSLFYNSTTGSVTRR